MHRILLLFGLAVLLISACSGGKDLEAKLQEIDKGVATIQAMTPAQKTEVGALAAEARTLKAAGKTEEAGRKADAALKIVQKARDADTFNKAE